MAANPYLIFFNNVIFPYIYQHYPLINNDTQAFGDINSL